MGDERNILWVKYGFDIPDPLKTDSICTHTYFDNKASSLVFRDTLAIPELVGNPFMSDPFNIRFYAGASIFLDDVKIGTLCILDTIPHPDFSAKDDTLIVEMADCVAAMMVAQYQHRLQELWNNLSLPCQLVKTATGPLEAANFHFQQMNCLYNETKTSILDQLKQGAPKISQSLQTNVSTPQKKINTLPDNGTDNQLTSLQYLQIAVNSFYYDVIQLADAIDSSLRKWQQRLQTSMPIDKEVFSSLARSFSTEEQSKDNRGSNGSKDLHNSPILFGERLTTFSFPWSPASDQSPHDDCYSESNSHNGSPYAAYCPPYPTINYF